MAVDKKKIITMASQLPIASDEKGIMAVFGVYAAINYNEFYYRLTSSAITMVDDAEENLIEDALYQAVLECAYHTFHGAMSSMEWIELFDPMIETPDDRIHALVAFTNIFGIGHVDLVELIPGEKLVTRVANAYDPGRYLKDHGVQPHGRCYMFNACNAGYMDLVYGGKYPHNMGTFRSKEVKCRSMGDAYCEFVATKAQ